jgi:predicted ATPase
VLAGGVLVGRDAELAVLDALITQAKAGAGGVVLLTGEPGVGKTRLARAGTERAAGATAPRTPPGPRTC